jgi:hypothetical protein
MATMARGNPVVGGVDTSQKEIHLAAVVDLSGNVFRMQVTAPAASSARLGPVRDAGVASLVSGDTASHTSGRGVC